MLFTILAPHAALYLIRTQIVANNKRQDMRLKTMKPTVATDWEYNISNL